MRLKFIFISVIVILVCSFLNFAVFSRELAVKSFELLPADLTARTKEVIDLNGDRCALIKISLPERECRFDGSVVKQEYDISEYLVYVSPGTRKFQIKYSGVETLNLDLVELLGGESVKSGSTYRLGLTGYEDLNNEKPKNDIGCDFLVINITPNTNAIVKINGELQTVEEGQVMAFVKYGNYEYSVEAEGYSPQKGVAKVDQSGKTVVNVKLESIKAQLSVISETPGSIIKINNQEKGVDNFTGPLNPGYYKIEVLKEGYRPYVESIQLGPKETKNVKVPPLTPITGTLKITYNPVGAKINLDGEYVGETPMVIKEILIGNHKMSITKDGFESYNASIDIKENELTSLEGSLKKTESKKNNPSNPITNNKNNKSFNLIEKVAQQEIYKFLRNEGLKTQIDDADNSVMFFIRDRFYYITFKGDGRGVFYTLHAEPIKFEFKDKNKASRMKENATVAANMLNAEGATKVYLADNRLHFSYPIFAKTPEEYTLVLKNIIADVAAAREKNYDFYLRKAKHVTDSIHNYWATNDTSKLVVPQKQFPEVKFLNSNNLRIEKVDYRNVNQNGEEISNYNASLRSSELEFIQPKITIFAPKKGEYLIGVKIINPIGKTLVACKDATYTIKTLVEADKKGKEVELDWFGDDRPGLWMPGDYTIIFYDGDKEIKRDILSIYGKK